MMLLGSAYPPPRYGISESASGARWAGYSEVLGRCLTHAMLEHMCWLLHLAVGQMPNGPFIPPAVSPRDQNNNVLPLFSRCETVRAAEAFRHLFMRRCLQVHVPPAVARPGGHQRASARPAAGSPARPR